MAPADGAGSAAKSTARRDLLLRIQSERQQAWAEERLFEPDAPLLQEGDDAGAEKPPHYFGNFPYPYMNGRLHLGHAFTVSKVEFATAYHRLQGKKTLFPFGFHCTGMPIKACADRLDREIKQYGLPPQFPDPALEDALPEAPAAAADSAPAPTAVQNGSSETADPTKFKGKKSKAAAKTGTGKFQWQIMQQLGLSDEEIASFRDPNHWLSYFPPLGMEDLKVMGCGIDWRRSFITTDVNPYYDSFVRWQLNTLHKQGKVVKDNRYTIFSPFDGQPCADHDRASGEGVLPQEYTLIKIEVIAPFTGKLAALEGKRVFLAAATLRPETMYGQTNAWVLPDGEYGAFDVGGGEVFVMTARAARNYAFQGGSPTAGQPSSLLELRGQDLIGVPLKAPLTTNPVIYALPMLTILTDKGTGVVTSVPSDAPDDYVALMDLKQKPALRAKYGVTDEMVMPFEVIPIINIPEFGDAAAVKVCTDLKIKSQNEKEKLAEAKRLTYLKGFTDGVLLVGEHAGQKVQVAKPLIQKMLLETGQAALYSEPEKKVMSRSGDECVVALTDQWYITYGEEKWRDLTQKCLSEMELYGEEARHTFEHTLGWLNQWACSRSFGLGTRLPWDTQFLIESLSDSTIYMAYYTVAHILQGGDLYGAAAMPIKPQQLTDAVWDHIFLGKPAPETDIAPELLQKMRSEFEFWYPFDLRVSGKDLIRNHLTFSIYNHTAIFDESKWPRAFRCNGHLLLNSEKMSKNTGNFKLLREAVEEASADATRFALADAGDTMDDANYVEETANAAILRLTKELAWIEEVQAGEDGETKLRTGDAHGFADRVFENEINFAVESARRAYDALLFREALKCGFYDLQIARDAYRLACGVEGMHRSLVERFIQVQTLLLTPICPHFADHVWRVVLKKPTAALTAGFPTGQAPDLALKVANTYLQGAITDFRKLIAVKMAPPKKGKGGAAAATPPAKPDEALVFVAETFGGWQEECLRILQSSFDAESRTFKGSDPELIAALKTTSVGQMADSKKVLGQCMPFLKYKKDQAKQLGATALDLRLPFDEAAVLRDNADLLCRQLGLTSFSVFLTSDADAAAKAGPESSKLATAVPGSPVAVFQASTANQMGALSFGK